MSKFSVELVGLDRQTKSLIWDVYDYI